MLRTKAWLEREVSSFLLPQLAAERGVKPIFKSDDDRRREAAEQAGKVCPACGGTGTYGVGGRGAWTSSPCSKCNGTGQSR